MMRGRNYSKEQERMLADAIGGFVNELRLVDVEHYAAFITRGQLGNIADIAESAAETFFAPGFLQMGSGGTVSLDWMKTPSVTLDFIMRPTGAKIYFSVRLEAEAACVCLACLSFDAGFQSPDCSTEFLRNAIEVNSIQRVPEAA